MRRDFKKSALTPVYNEDALPRPTFGLGLMGGGSWGAFTAGVLESIVPTLESIGQIRAISGTSAGAINGALLTGGLNNGGAHHALRNLDNGWNAVKENGHFIQMASNFTDWFLPPQDRWPNFPTYFNMMAGLQIANNYMPSRATNYLSGLVRDIVPDWQTVQKGRVEFSANTLRKNIHTGDTDHIILSGKDLTPDGVAASAALKELGVHKIKDRNNQEDSNYIYMDGGYVENPPTKPLLDANVTDIIMIILHDFHHQNTTPPRRDKLYHEEIHTDITSLALADNRNAHIHAIEIEMANGAINGWHLNHTSKMNTSPAFINALRESGRKVGKKWLAENLSAFGVESSYRPRANVVEDMVAMGYHY